jgi:hypothetical protein
MWHPKVKSKAIQEKFNQKKLFSQIFTSSPPTKPHVLYFFFKDFSFNLTFFHKSKNSLNNNKEKKTPNNMLKTLLDE